jgi:HAD superfamily hydrolase (TIGR01509 family)
MTAPQNKKAQDAKRGVLFDMDGVLAATEDLKARAHSETVKRYGGDLDPDFYGQVMGQSHHAAAVTFIQASGADLDPDTYAEAFRSVYGDLLKAGVDLMPGAERLLAAVKEQGFRVAVVTSSLRWMMDEVLSRTGLAEFFEISVSADDVSAEKPSPEPYLGALAGLSLAPADAVIVEDSESGVASGVNAGVRVIAVRHQYNSRHDMSQAFAELGDLTDTQLVLTQIRRALYH